MSQPITLMHEGGDSGEAAEKRVHLIGVAGSGMLGLASLLLERGFSVSGSDLRESMHVKRLVDRGLEFTQGHVADVVLGVNEVVYSSAIQDENEERMRAKADGIKESSRAEALAEIIAERRNVVVAGMHGKTTVTSMITHVLQSAKLEPGFYVGAEVEQLGGYAAWGNSPWMVVEGDESDGSLQRYKSNIGILLNIEAEHLDYFSGLEEIKKFFAHFLDNTEELCVGCVDCENVRVLLEGREKVLRYGFSQGADIKGAHYRVEDGEFCFDVECWGEEKGSVKLSVPGKHNALNALATIAVALHVGVSFESIQNALSRFKGAKRRFEILADVEECMVVDDYAHHPTEIEATLKAAKERLGGRRIVAAFEPHRYSRVERLWKEFVGCFGQADQVLVTEVFAASECIKEGVGGERLVEEISSECGKSVAYLPTLQHLESHIKRQYKEGDVVILMGAGNINEVAARIASCVNLYQDLKVLMGGEAKVKLFEPFSKHTTLRVGGPGDVWCEPKDEGALGKVVRFCHEREFPLFVVGRGSNLLVGDGGVRGVCVHLASDVFKSIEIKGDLIDVGAGVRLKDIVFTAKKQGIGGLEFMEGIPGHLGGAMRMNAGAMGASMFDVIESVRVMTLDGEIKEFKRSEVDALYRNVPLFENHLALGATIRGQKIEEQAINDRLKSYSKKRWASQPAAASAGCSFKNSGEIPTGKLIDELGLKDFKHGGARISDVHGNFIVNDGDASASDVMWLIEYIRKEAKEKRGIDLQTEVVIVGDLY